MKGQAGLQDVDEILRVRVFLLTEGTLQEMLVPEAVAGKFLGAVDRDGVGMIDQVAAKGLGANQPPYQVDMDLFEVGDIDVAQQPKQGIGMGQGFDLGEQQPQVGLELGSSQLAVDLASSARTERRTSAAHRAAAR